MKMSSYLENYQRGTPDFPMEIHSVNENHPRYYMQFHWHSDIEIICVSAGKLDITLNDSHFVIQAGESVIIPGGVVHGATPEKCEYTCIVFAKSMLYASTGIRRLIKNSFRQPVVFGKYTAVEELIEKASRAELPMLTIVSLLFEIMSEALKFQEKTEVLYEEKIERIKPAIMYIEENYSQHIDVETLAKECLMSNNYFIKYFKEVTNQTPVSFLNQYRIEAGCEMLLAGNNVTETAFACGFNDISYFIHVFKKTVGVSPKKYAETV